MRIITLLAVAIALVCPVTSPATDIENWYQATTTSGTAWGRPIAPSPGRNTTKGA